MSDQTGSDDRPVLSALLVVTGMSASILAPLWIVASKKAADEVSGGFLEQLASGNLGLSALSQALVIGVALAVRRYRARLVVMCTAMITLLLVSLHALQPDIDPRRDAISLYAVTSHGYLMALIFALSSGLFLASGLHLTQRSGSRLLKPISMILVGVLVGTSILTGVFEADPGQSMTSELSDLSPSGATHKAAGGIAFPFRLAFPFLILVQLSRTFRHRAVRAWLWILASAFPLLIAAAVALPNEGGLIQRVFLIGYLAWLTAAILATNDASQPTASAARPS